MLPQILLSLGVAWIAYTFLTLAVNVHRARAMKVPLIVVPVSPMNTLWIVFEPLVFRILDRLRFRLGSFGRYGRRGWHFHDKAASHVELGDAWALVTPRETFLHVCNPEAINEVFARRQDFVRPIQLYSKEPVYLPSQVSLMEGSRDAGCLWIKCFYGMYCKGVTNLAHRKSRSAGQNGNTKERLSLLLSTKTRTSSCGRSP